METLKIKVSSVVNISHSWLANRMGVNDLTVQQGSPGIHPKACEG